MLKVAFSMAVLMLAAGCASKPKPVALKPEIKSIAIISATTPAAFSLGNANAVEVLFPVAGTLFYLDGRAKAKVFNERFLAEPSTLAANFSEEVASALRGDGYQVQILEGLAISTMWTTTPSRPTPTRCCICSSGTLVFTRRDLQPAIFRV